MADEVRYPTIIPIMSNIAVDFTIDEKTTNIRVMSKAALPEFEEDELKRYAVSGLFLAYYKQIEDMLEEYYDYLDVSVVDRAYDE